MVYYCIITNQTVKIYVNTNNLSALDEYLTNPNPVIDNTDSDDDGYDGVPYSIGCGV